MKKLYKTWVASKPECLSSTRMITVGVNDLFLPYFLLVLGVAGSAIILLGEMIWIKAGARIKRCCSFYSSNDKQ